MLFFLLANLNGCNNRPTVEELVANATNTNVKRLAKMYTVYMSSHNWVGPENAGELKAFINGQDPAQMRAMGIDPDNLDSLFVDEAEEPGEIKVRWKLATTNLSAPLPIVFQTKASPEGLHEIGFSGAPAKQVTTEQYQRLWSGEGDDTSTPTNRRR